MPMPTNPAMSMPGLDQAVGARTRSGRRCRRCRHHRRPGRRRRRDHRGSCHPAGPSGRHRESSWSGWSGSWWWSARSRRRTTAMSLSSSSPSRFWTSSSTVRVVVLILIGERVDVGRMAAVVVGRVGDLGDVGERLGRALAEAQDDVDRCRVTGGDRSGDGGDRYPVGRSVQPTLSSASKERPSGRASRTSMFEAATVPWLNTVIRNSTRSPGSTTDGLAGGERLA